VLFHADLATSFEVFVPLTLRKIYPKSFAEYTPCKLALQEPLA